MKYAILNIGFGNGLMQHRIISILAPDSAPMKRLREEARLHHKLIDATCGRRTRSILITDSDHVVLSALQPETLINRMTEVTHA